MDSWVAHLGMRLLTALITMVSIMVYRFKWIDIKLGGLM